MTNTELTFPPVSSLSVPQQVTPQLSNFTLSAFAYEWAIAGQPFLGVASDEFPMIRAFTTVNKDQFDNSVDPGEQSLTGWWLRSQRDFSSGAGIRFLEPASDERIMRRFRDSVGVDVWTPGEFKLLRVMEEDVTTSGVARCVSVVNAGTDYVYSTTGSGVTRSTGSATTAITSWTAAPDWLVSTGNGVFGFHASGIDYSAASGTTASSLWTGATSSGRGWWVKQRLIAAYGAALHELGGFTGGALPSAIYTHPISTWTWTAAVETPGAILVSGYAGNQSAIYKFTVDETDGELPTLTSAVTVAELPVGEYVTGMFSYLGTYVVLGTNKGVRVAQVGDTGQVAYGPLTFETTSPVEFFCGSDRFVFCGVKDGIAGSSGVYRIDLSDFDEAGRAAYATDVSTGVTGAVDGVCLLGSSDRVCVGVNSDATFVTSASTLVSTGFLRTAFVRYNTLENKSFRFVSVRRKSKDGEIVLESVDLDEGGYSLYTFTDGSPDVEVATSPMFPVEALSLKFTLNRSATDSTKGPVVSGWQFKALPAVQRKQRWRLPLLCFDEVTDRFGNRAGGPGFAYKQYGDLKTALLTGVPVTLQDFMAKESFIVLIEDIQLTQTSPPRGSSGLGGVLIVTCREL